MSGRFVLSLLLSSLVWAQNGDEAKKVPVVVGADALILDVKGNGIDLSGEVRDRSGNGVRWTKARTDDAFLMIDCDAAKAAGCPIEVGASEQVEEAAGLQVLKGSFRRVGQPQDPPVLHVFAVLAQLDGNGDGQLNGEDPEWACLRAGVDANADGLIEPSECRTLAESGVAAIVLWSGDAEKDATKDEHGNDYLPGSYPSTDDSAHDFWAVTLGKLSAGR